MSVATRRSLYGKLAGDTTLNNLLAAPPSGFAKSIFYQLAPQGAKFPFVILQKQAGTPTYAFAANSSLDAEVWLVKGVDDSPSADVVDNIASRLDSLLTDGVLTISGATQLYLRRESDVDYLETHDDAQFRHAGALFRLVYD